MAREIQGVEEGVVVCLIAIIENADDEDVEVVLQRFFV